MILKISEYMKKNIIGELLIYVFLFIVFVLAVLTSLLLQRENDTKYNVYYHKFDTTRINGMLLKVFDTRHGTKISIKNYRDDFLFRTKNFLNDDIPFFYKIAKRGDSIFKPAYSKYIKLIKIDGRQYDFKIKDYSE